MRNIFAKELTAHATDNDRIVMLSGDIGNRLFDDFKKVAPNRFYNCGVAEANMIGMAAGMAMMGFHPVTYTITPFTTIRCLEQIRIDLCYHNLPVVIVGTGSGLSYAELGPTHHSCDDMGVLRILPNMTILSPCDPIEVKLALKAALEHDGPVYLRLGKKGEPALHREPPVFAIGKAITLRPGNDVCILGTGPVLAEALTAAKMLENECVSTRIESVHTVKPLDTALLGEIFNTFKLVVTLEEHSLIGGLGGGVAEWLADNSGYSGRLLRFGTADRFFEEIGTQEYAREVFGLTAEHIFAGIRNALQ